MHLMKIAAGTRPLVTFGRYISQNLKYLFLAHCSCCILSRSFLHSNLYWLAFIPFTFFYVWLFGIIDHCKLGAGFRNSLRFQIQIQRGKKPKKTETQLEKNEKWKRGDEWTEASDRKSKDKQIRCIYVLFHRWDVMRCDVMWWLSIIRNCEGQKTEYIWRHLEQVDKSCR